MNARLLIDRLFPARQRVRPDLDEDALRKLLAAVHDTDPAWKAIVALLDNLLVVNFSQSGQLALAADIREECLRQAHTARWLLETLDRLRAEGRKEREEQERPQ